MATIGAAILLWPAPWADACSIFAASKNGLVLVGNNEDYYLHVIPRVWVDAGGPDEYGRITFGFGPEKSRPFAQGGVNSAGLFFDAAVIPKIGPSPKRKPKPPGNMGDDMLAECSTVNEALAWLRKYDLHRLEGCHFLLADKSGAATVAEFIGGELKEIPSGKKYIAATNFAFTKPEAGNFPCPRFETIRAALGDATPDPDVSIDGFRALLAATVVARTPDAEARRDGGTLYSNIYDLSNGTITVYRESRWDASLRIDVAEWLARGDESIPMDTLFATPVQP